MNIRFNIEKNQRKALAQKIGELAEMDVRYCGVPSCAYEIGFFTLSKDAVLSFADRMDTEVIEKVLDGLDKAGYTSEDEPEALTISMPRDFFTEQSMNNLLQLIANKETLLKHALNTESLAINECEETIEFPWFTIKQDGDGDAYAKFITIGFRVCRFSWHCSCTSVFFLIIALV
jgi:hypothetical protein